MKLALRISRPLAAPRIEHTRTRLYDFNYRIDEESWLYWHHGRADAFVYAYHRGDLIAYANLLILLISD
jgi:hypothetical protein